VTQRIEATVSQFAGIYREWAPRASLRRHVRCLWINDLSRSRREWLQVVPDGCVDTTLPCAVFCVSAAELAANGRLDETG
jgi:hypothetical protein